MDDKLFFKYFLKYSFLANLFLTVLALILSIFDISFLKEASFFGILSLAVLISYFIYKIIKYI